MRDLDEHEDDAPPPDDEPAGGPKAIVSTSAGATLAVGLIAGGAWWLAGAGEHTAQELPVFRAELGPAKVRPEDPGGAETPYRDISSYEAAAGSGAAAEPRIALAPPPAEPAAEDLAMAELTPSGAAVVLDAGQSAGMAMAEPQASDEAEEAAADRESASAGGPPVPQPRPSSVPRQAATEAPAPGPAQATTQEEIDRAVRLAARAALSPVQIQLGAFTDRAYTESEWRRIADANADLLDGLALAIQPTTSGGTKFYRLRVGPFDDRSAAGRVCEALKARGQDCLVAENS